MKRFIAALFLFLVIAPGAVFASSEKINSFHSDIELLQNGTADITEFIDYDFGNNERHGIFRDIPYKYHINENQGYLLDFKVKSVEKTGTCGQLDQCLNVGGSEPYDVSKEGSYYRLKIGDANKTVSGGYTYIISYSLSPVVVKNEKLDILRLDVTGEEWQVPILSASATLKTAGMSPTNLTCYSGKFGANNSICTAQQSGNSISFEYPATLNPGDNFTIEASFPPGSFENYATLKNASELNNDTPAIVGFLIFIGIFLGVIITFGYIMIRYLRYLYKRSQELVVPQYEPPRHLSPGEIGLLEDNISNGRELTATIIDLAVRGYLKIEQTKKPRLV